ncbi:MAG: hypothetical protein E7470_02350 [Ruminococcaceae bacterium]|nr:hypothetical protein [Oscillospiraceae bacterium]
MEETLLILNSIGESVTKEEVLCFVKVLLIDLKSDNPKVKWERDTKSPWGTFCSSGFTGTSCIRLQKHRIRNQPVVLMNYEKDGNFVFNAEEFDGDPNNTAHLAHLYRLIAATVIHREIYNDISTPNAEIQLSIEEMGNRCLKVNQLFCSVTANEVANTLMHKPSVVNLNISNESPEWHRRIKLIHNLVHVIQCTRVRESSLILDGFALKKANGQLCGHLTTDPIAKWANAHVIVDSERYPDFCFDEIRVKVAADIIGNLLMVL